MSEGRRWTERDRSDNQIYLTQERWEHITDPVNHPEMTDFENELRETIRSGNRKQEMLDPQKYRYSKAFENLTAKNTHIVAVVVFKFAEDEQGNPAANNFIVTAYQKKVW